MAVKIVQFTPEGALSADGYITVTLLNNSPVTFSAQFLESTQTSLVGSASITNVKFQVAQKTPSPLGLGNGGLKNYQDIPGSSFNPGAFTQLIPPTLTTPGVYEVEFTTNNLTAAANGDYYRVVITSSTGEIATSEVHYSDGTSVVPGVYDDEYYQSLDGNFPEGLGTFGDPEDFNNDFFANIGPREILIISDPELFITTETYDPTYILQTNSTLTLFAGASYLNINTTSPAAVADISITWQKSFNFDPNTGAGTWTNIVSGDNIVDEGSYSETESSFVYSTDPGTGDQFYAKGSTLVISNIGFQLNGVYLRPVYFGPSAPNSPVISTNRILLVVDPQITIVRQPGVAASDTDPTAYCYSLGNPSNGIFSTDNGGDIRLSVSAVSSIAGAELNYQWQFRIFNDGHALNSKIEVTPEGWTDLVEGNEFSGGYFTISQGSLLTDSTMVLRRLQYYDRYLFRVVITGTTGESPVNSDPFEIYIRDNISYPTTFNGGGSVYTAVSNEDFYGNIPDRNLFTLYPIRTVTFTSALEISNYAGLQGNVFVRWQRSDTNGSTWYDIGSEDRSITYARSDGNSANPDSGLIPYNLSYTTPPLKIGTNANGIAQNDDNSRYRIKLSSSAVYTFNAGGNREDPSTMKTLVPWFSTAIGYYALLDLYREIFIIGEPNSVELFLPNIAAFEVTVAATSNSGNLVYQWQRSPSVSGQPSGVWTNITAGPLFGVTGQNVAAGVNGTTLSISNTTVALDRSVFFRVVVSYNALDNPGALASVTSTAVTARVVPDIFDLITTINDKFLDEYADVTWTVNASTLSLGNITFQWQRSYNYGTAFQNATWSNLTDGSQVNGGTIAGSTATGTTTTLNIGGVRKNVDKGYYRVRMVSTGGIVAFSNIVYLGISSVEIIFTKNFPTSFTFVEDDTIAPFSVAAYSSIGEEVDYLWQYRKVGDPAFQAFSLGANFEPSTSNPYEPVPFSKNDNWDGAQIRAQVSITALTVFSNVATIDVRRRFYYFADTDTRRVPNGSAFSIDLRPSWTGLDTPTYSWEYSSNGGSSWASVSGLGAVNNLETLYIATITNANDGYLFRCRVTLNLVDDFVYSRNNIGFVDTSNPDGTIISTVGYGYTENIQLDVIDAPIYPVYFSRESGKTGAAIGTVICVPKPPTYINNNDTAVVDDIAQWGTSITGDPFSTGNTNSKVTSGATFNQNKSYLDRGFNWVSSTYVSPKWLLADDRFPGFIELRGQWVLKSDFPVLYSIIGDLYGSTSTQFKLPNPYGKKMMGTGAINSQSGRTSVIPLFGADGQSGGDRLIPGTIGGVYIYEQSRQLPPGSPGVSGQPDGSAGSPDPATFTLGTYRTDGWQDSQGITFTNFVGNFTYRVGPLGGAVVASPPPHQHGGTAVSAQQSRASSDCTRSSDISPTFYGIDYGGGEVLQGPEYISSTERGITHTHGLSSDSAESGNDYGLNHGTGKGDVPTGDSYTQTVNINYIPNSTEPTLNVFLEFADVTMSVASRNKFDNALRFYVRNSEPIPITSNYFRVKWLIKAY